MSLSIVRRFLFVIAFLLIAQAAFACLWDTDTLANEAKGLPDVVQVITGRFERNPPLYFEMRLKRVTEELAKEPGLLADYDDAGVACDRLSRDDEAIAWMQKKRVQLQKLDRNSPEVKEHWYHYYANIGTFRAHRWFRAGADRKHISELEQARDEIGKAIEINPNAHFGREKVQLAFMSWAIKPMVKIVNKPPADPDVKTEPPKGKEEQFPFFEYIAEKGFEATEKPVFRRDIPGGGGTEEEWIKGLNGLIVLGNAWESVDTFDTLAWLFTSGKATVGYLARLRCQELTAQGHKSLFPDQLPADVIEVYVQHDPRVAPDHLQRLRDQYQRLRAEAEEWQKQRTDYMMVRLNAGRHPDTDPTFWNDWHDAGPPSLELSWFQTVRDPYFIGKHLGWYALAFLMLMGAIVVIVRTWRRWRRWRLQSKSIAVQR